MDTKRKLSETEKKMVTALSMDVIFLPDSYDKKFCRGLNRTFDYTEKQVAYLRKCFHKYRRQIKDYQKIISNATTTSANNSVRGLQ